MSQRSVIEINHDYCYEIARDPEAFVKALDMALGSGSAQSWEPLRRFGIRRATQHHHSSTAVAVVTAEGGHISYVASFPGDIPPSDEQVRHLTRRPRRARKVVEVRG